MMLRCSVTSRIGLVGDGVSYFRHLSGKQSWLYPVGRDDSGGAFLESTCVASRAQGRVPYDIDDTKFSMHDPFPMP